MHGYLARPGLVTLGRLAPVLVLFLALSLAVFGWIQRAITNQLHERLPLALSGTTVTLNGSVRGLPVARESGLEFRFAVDPGQATWSTAPLIQVRWPSVPSTALADVPVAVPLDAPVEVRAGDRWRLTLRLRPARGRLNFLGPDSQRWYFTEGIDALGTASATGNALLGRPGLSTPADWSPGQLLRKLDALRELIRERLLAQLGDQPGQGLVLALTVADRSYLSETEQTALRVTGTAHLLAISGMHVGLVAGFAWWLLRGLFGWLPPRWPAREAAWLGALTVATLYAGLAGFETSTRRSLWMLGVLVVCQCLRRPVSPWRGWFIALLLVLLLEPLAPFAASAWLSFGAVAVLLALFTPRYPRPGKLRALLLAQPAITLVTLPLVLFWFAQAPLGGLLANLLAIPWVTLITLPLSLLAVLLLPLAGETADGLTSIITGMAAVSADWVMQFLLRLSVWVGDWVLPLPRVAGWAIILASLGTAAWLLPRGTPGRALAAVLVLPLLWQGAQGALAARGAPQLEPGEFELELLDVGQGLALVLRTRGHVLLYDTGPGLPQQWDLVDEVLLPALPRAGPDLLLVSHSDLDHAGGLGTLRTAWSESGPIGVYANLGRRQAGYQPCDERLAWDWDGVAFQVLHPGRYLPYLGNESSCVLSVKGQGGSVLLPGDVSRRVENRLALRSPGTYQVLLAPHHGSRSSSSAGFLAELQPELVLIGAGADNRFGFPHAEVLATYAETGAEAWSTSDCGAMRLRMTAKGLQGLRSAVTERPAPWRFASPGECP